ncbi:MAG: triose-phosphate isomerase [Spirochaetes bacterium]|nr:triose-phosphate isomerase [Spirochaetota bacterium]
MRTPMLAGNWKMNKTIPEAVALAEALAKVEIPAGREAVVCPSFVCLVPVKKALGSSKIQLGCQNMHFEAKGAFTGETSAEMLKSAEVSHVIIGHSERRALFGETDAVVNRKVKAVLAAGLKVILCVGEVLAEREKGVQNDVVKTQLTGGLDGVPAADLARVIIAYEPVWAIGTGKTATPEDADAMHAFIRGTLAALANAQVAEATRILYGGSANDANIDSLMAKPNIDGALIGGAALKPESFTRMIQYKA